MARWRVIAEFIWGGKQYRPGDVLELGDTHRRLGGLIQGQHVVYDCSVPSDSDRYGEPVSQGAKR